MREFEVLHKPFDIETHKRTFVNYLEVVILDNGQIEYAVPSHQEKLISIAMDRLKVTRQELYNLCPPEFYFDVIAWLCIIARCVSVWNDFSVGKCNPEQMKSLQMLKEHGVYRGKVI